MMAARLRFTTPCDYYQVLFDYLPWFFNLKEAITCVLEFVMILSVSCQYKAEKIFYASVLATLTYKGFHLSDIQTTILRSLSDSWESIDKLAEVILKELRARESEA